MISISDAHQRARLEGTKAFIDSGPGVPKFLIFDGARPANGAAPTGSPLVEIELTKFGGVVEGDKLKLVALAPAQVTTTGTAVWARLLNAGGQHVLDCDAGGPTNTTAEVVVSAEPLFLGANVVITVAEFG